MVVFCDQMGVPQLKKNYPMIFQWTTWKKSPSSIEFLFIQSNATIAYRKWMLTKYTTMLSLI